MDTVLMWPASSAASEEIRAASASLVSLGRPVYESYTWILSLPKTASGPSSDFQIIVVVVLYWRRVNNALDSSELKFRIRQIDEYIQVTEFMIRKTALDHGELALARNLRTKLSPGKQTEHRRKNIAKKPG